METELIIPDHVQELLNNLPVPVRFEIVPQRLYTVYGFEKDSTLGISYGSFNTIGKAQKRLAELENYYLTGAK